MQLRGAGGGGEGETRIAKKGRYESYTQMPVDVYVGVYFFTNMQIDLASTFIETIGGTLIGIVIGLFINIIAEWRSEWHSKMNLRRALIAELESAETLLKKIVLIRKRTFTPS